MTPEQAKKLGIKVKPLDWQASKVRLTTIVAFHSAELSFGKWVYSIAEMDDGTAKLWIESVVIDEFPTLEAAKAAAQADYEARILEALE